MDGRELNAARFTGFADIYDSARPTVPQYPIDVICEYLGKKPSLVVDIGCGTGLSTMVWAPIAAQVIGVEPSADMLAIARRKEAANVSFVQAFSDNTTLTGGCADVVTASQSFHWMEPAATLAEVNRILKPGGVFAAIDCDWPPVTLWQAEHAYAKLYGKVKELERTADIAGTFVHYSKSEHLKNIIGSGYFRYAREVVFSNTERCTAERFINLILSQGSLQTILKRSPQLLTEDIAEFTKTVRGIFAEREFDIEFCYRMRIGVK